MKKYYDIILGGGGGDDYLEINEPNPEPRKPFWTNKRMFLVGFWGIMCSIPIALLEKANFKTSFTAIPAVIFMVLFVVGVIKQMKLVWKEEMEKLKNNQK